MLYRTNIAAIVIGIVRQFLYSSAVSAVKGAPSKGIVMAGGCFRVVGLLRDDCSLGPLPFPYSVSLYTSHTNTLCGMFIHGTMDWLKMW